MNNYNQLKQYFADNFVSEKVAAEMVPATPAAPAETLYDDDQDEYIPVGLSGLLASTEKLLAVNRGLTPTDDRDSWGFKRVKTPDMLMRERVRLDASKTRLNMLRNAARMKNLSGVHSFAFNPYSEGLLVGNSLSMPLEEINPMQLVEQSRRITMMGPGGIGSEDAITADMQAINATQFGFISPLEGPECHSQDSEVYTLRGWIPWNEVRDADVFACRVNGRLEWHKAERVIREPYTGPMIIGEHETVRLCVTPSHRVLNTRDVRYRLDTAQEVFGKGIKLPIRHLPYLGNPKFTHFSLPKVKVTNSNQRVFEPFAIADWCEFMGWWLSEGSSCAGTRLSSGGTPYAVGAISISQCSHANEENFHLIQALLQRMGLRGESTKLEGRAFSVSAKQLVAYFEQWENGCYDKWIPIELFEAPIEARQRMLEALLRGDGRFNKKRWCYCTVSPRLAQSVERLAISLGYTAFIRVEQDAREHVRTTNYVVSIHRQKHRQLLPKAYTHSNGKSYGDNWRIEQYEGVVYCATVPGGLLHVRGKRSTSGHWSGNSSRAGVDVRLSWGTKYGSDGKIYQRFWDPRKKKYAWLSPEQVIGKVVKIPD